MSNGTPLGPTMSALPVTDKFRPRPTMTRLQLRIRGIDPGPANEEERRDAIAVLRFGPNADDPSLDPLYREAELIFHEASA